MRGQANSCAGADDQTSRAFWVSLLDWSKWRTILTRHFPTKTSGGVLIAQAIVEGYILASADKIFSQYSVYLLD